jgi:threonine dehydrogenase-like Zn-dependent dehydrogenase
MKNLGLGPIGLLVCQWAKNVFGAGRVIGIDSVPERLNTANKLFGVEPVDFTEHKDVVSRILELEPRGLDIAIDCAAFRYAKTHSQKAERAAGMRALLPVCFYMA